MAQPIPIAGLAAGYMLLSLFAIWALYLSLPLQVRLIRSLFNILGRRNDLRTMLFGVFVLISTPLVIGSALTVLQKAPPAVQYYLLTGAQLLAVVQSVLLIVAFITWLVMFGVRFLGQPVFARRYELFVGWNLLRSHSTKQHQPRPFEGATPPAQWTTQLLGILFLLVLATSFTVQWPVLLDTYADIVPWLRWGIGSSAVLLLTWPLRRTPAPGSVDRLDRLEARAKNLPDVLTVTANTFISIVGVGVGVWAVIVVLSVMSGFENDLRDKILKTNPHVVIQDDEPMEGIPNYRNTLQSIRELDGVIAAIPYVQGDVIVTSRENRNISLSLRGITPSDLSQSEHHLESSMVSGSTENLMYPERLIPTSRWRLGHTPEKEAESPLPDIPTPSEDDIEPTPIPGIESTELETMSFGRVTTADEGLRPGILLGEELAISLRVGVGGEVTVVSPRDDAGFLGIQPRARTFRVAGIFRTGMYEFDLKLAYIRMSEAQRFFQLGTDINRIELRLSNVDTSTEVVQALAPILGNTKSLNAVDWKQLNRNLFSALQLEKLAMLVVLLIIIAVAALNVLGSLLMLLLERGREVAILKSLGATRGELRRIFISLGSVVGTIGSSAGLLMGLATVGFIRYVGVRMPRQYYVDQLPVHVDPLTISLIFFLGIALCVAATLYPAFMASRGRPVEGFRNV